MVASFKILAKPLGRTLGPNQDAFLRLNFCGKARRKREIFVRCFSDSQDNIVRSTFAPIKVPEVPFHEFVFERLGQWGDRIAVECGITDKKYSYKEIYKMSNVLASSLQKKFKLKKGDNQCLLLPNCPDFPGIILAGSKIGVTACPINPIYTPAEISVLINIARPKIIFTELSAYEKCRGALNVLQLKIPIVLVKMSKDDVLPTDAVDFSELVQTTNPVDCDPVSIDVKDDVIIPFSSGTSGLPKGVQLSHINVTSNLRQVESAATLLRKDTRKESIPAVVLSVLPMFHIYGMMVVCFDALRSGAHLVTLPRFEPKMFVQTLYTKQIGTAYLVPPLIFFLANQPAVEEKHLKHLNIVITGAASCGVSDVLSFKKKCPNVKLSQGYGMTETSPVITATHLDRLHKVGAVGHPMGSTLLKIIDTETGEALPMGSIGEVCVKGPQVMTGYYKQPEITKNTFDSDGWLKTGDTGYCDEDDDLFIVDRLKELIKVKGYQVAPAEIEEFLRSHPKIADTGVIGVPHEGQGEAPRAFVVLKEGVSMSEEEIIQFVADNLSRVKHLKGGVRFMKTIPKSSAGKILRRELRKMEEEKKAKH